MAIPFLAPLLATKFGKPLIFGGMFLFVIGAVFLLGRCTGGDDDVAAQVEQTNRSGEAISNAAEMAIDKIGDRAVTEASIDAAVNETVKEIDRAESADAIHDAVVRRLCVHAEHRNDPACQLRQADPR